MVAVGTGGRRRGVAGGEAGQSSSWWGRFAPHGRVCKQYKIGLGHRTKALLPRPTRQTGSSRFLFFLRGEVCCSADLRCPSRRRVSSTATIPAQQKSSWDADPPTARRAFNRNTPAGGAITLATPKTRRSRQEQRAPAMSQAAASSPRGPDSPARICHHRGAASSGEQDARRSDGATIFCEHRVPGVFRAGHAQSTEVLDDCLRGDCEWFSAERTLLRRQSGRSRSNLLALPAEIVAVARFTPTAHQRPYSAPEIPGVQRCHGGVVCGDCIPGASSESSLQLLPSTLRQAHPCKTNALAIVRSKRPATGGRHDAGAKLQHTKKFFCARRRSD